MGHQEGVEILVSSAKVFYFLLGMRGRLAPNRILPFRDVVANAFHNATGIASQYDESISADHIDIDSHWDEALSLLSFVEVESAKRFYRDTNRRAYVFAHAILRLLLAMRCDVDPKAIRFARGIYGKPILEYPSCGVHFNLSYGDGAFAIALSDIAVGMDIERLRGDIDVLAISRRYFVVDEQMFLEAATAEERLGRFFGLWTRKEALVKAAGTGLDAMGSFSVMEGLITAQDEFGQAGDFFIHTLDSVSGHAFALAVREFSAVKTGAG